MASYFLAPNSAKCEMCIFETSKGCNANETCGFYPGIEGGRALQCNVQLQLRRISTLFKTTKVSWKSKQVLCINL